MNRRNHKYGTPIGITIMNMMMMMVLRDDVFGCSMSRWCGCATSLPLLPVASAAAWIAAIPPPAGRLLPGGASAAFLHQRRPLASTTKTTRLWGDGGSPATAASSTTTATTGSGGSSSYTLDGQDIRGPIVPVGNILVVKVKDTLTATGGGILLPDQSKQRPTEGLVVAAGPGRIHPHTAVRIVNPVSTGVSVV